MNTLIEVISSSNMSHLLDDKIYSDRFDKECELIHNLDQAENILFAYKIKSIIETFDLPFFIRGSAGGSLVLYMLGFTTIDPVKNNILFERFINEFRDSLGDIDFDLPKSMRNTILNHVYKKLAKENIFVGRLCSRVYYKENSSIREILRRLGHKSTVPSGIMKDKTELESYLSKNNITMEKVLSSAEKINGTLRYVSKHVGGIVVLNEGETYMYDKRKKVNVVEVPVVNLDKYDVDKQKRFKVDLLSNTALDILHFVYPSKQLTETNYPYKQEVFDMIGQGDTIGVVFAESPLMISVLKSYHHKHRITSIDDIAKCLSIIRPMGRGAGKNSDLIFDDDWIRELSNICQISYSDADRQRKRLAKGDAEFIAKLKSLVSFKRLRQLMQIKHYGFCKAHAYNYAQLIYCQAYAKKYNKEEFFCAMLNTLSGRMYADVVYYLEIVRNKVIIFADKKKDEYVVRNINGKRCIIPRSGIQSRLFPLSVRKEYESFGGVTTMNNIQELNGEVVCRRKWRECIFQSVLHNGKLINEVIQVE